MNQYRVSLWIENEGDIPDVDLQFQVVNAVPELEQLVMAAFFLARKTWVREVRIEVLIGDQWSKLGSDSNVSLCGSSGVWVCW